MRRALLKRLPALTHFYGGALHPLNVELMTLREVSEYVTFYDRYMAEQDKRQPRG